MILYVDETENDDFFIVCGLLVSSVEVIETSYKHFKKAVKNYPISDNEKQIVFKGLPPKKKKKKGQTENSKA